MNMNGRQQGTPIAPESAALRSIAHVSGDVWMANVHSVPV